MKTKKPGNVKHRPELNLNKVQRAYIKSKGITQYRLAQKTGMSHNAMSDFFLGKKRASIETYSKICNALELTLSEFFAMGEQDNKKEK